MGFIANMIKDFKSMFNSSLLNSRDSDLILLDLESEFTTYVALDDVLDSLQSNVYTGKKAQIVKAMNDELLEGEEIENIFRKYGLITIEEYLIFSKATSVKDAVNAVLEYRKDGNLFPQMMFTILFPFIFFGTIALLVIRIVGEFLMNYFNTEIKPIMAERVGFTPEISFPAMIQDSFFGNMIIGIWLLTIFASFFIFFRIYQKSPEVIYKFSKIKFYDDFIKYFSIADKMHQVGATGDEIMEFLKDKANPFGLREMFKEMYEHGSDYFITLQKFNAPGRLVSMVRRKENSSRFWNDLESDILQYAKHIRGAQLGFFKKYFGKLFLYIGFIILFISLLVTFASFGMAIWALA